MHSLVHNAAHSAATPGHVLGSPRLYELTVELFFMGRRRSTYRALVAAARIRPGHRVLDVGCGTGYFARIISETVGASGVVAGIDPSEPMIDYARRQATCSAKCEFQVGAAQALPFPDDTFDVATSSLVVHHLPEDLRVRALDEMRRVLRPGGRLLVAEARNPPSASLCGLMARAHGFDRMASQVPNLEPLAAAAGFVEVESNEAPPWVRYVTARKA
jgi:ubiquinone/menaquinone biosynthesis C-methylase UbiE